jgi:hypothetical protein
LCRNQNKQFVFSPIQCFRTFAVWKHFSIYPSPSRGRTCPTRNSSFSSANILPAWDSLTNSDRYRRLYQRIFAIEFSILRIGEYPIPSIIDILNSIRLAKGNVFAEWKQSDTAKLFEDHGYKNKKESGGYFF